MAKPKKQYSQAERVLMIYDSLWRGASVRAVELADELGLSRRTCERDLAVLKRVLGPRLVEEERLEHKVYRIPRQLNNAEVSREQVLAYLCGTKLIEFMSGPAFRLDARGLADLLSESLPTADRIPTARLERKVRVTQVGDKMYADQPEKQRDLSLMTEALLYERPIEVAYLSPRSAAAGREPVVRWVHPLAMVLHRGGVHYVVDFQGGWRGARRRLLALDRLSVQSYDDRSALFEYPKDFSLDEFFGDAFGIFRGDDAFTVKLRFPPHYRQYVEERTWHPNQEVEEDDQGRLLLSFPVAGEVEISDWILGMGPNVEVLEPSKLRDRIAARLQETLSQYGEV